MIPYMVGKLAPHSSHLNRGLVKYVPSRGYFRAVPSQNEDKFVTTPSPPIVELVFIIILVLFETEVIACICHSPLHHQKPDFEGQSVIKASSYLLPFVLEAHRESLPRSCETSARRLSAESAEVYSTADLPASAAHIPFSEFLIRYRYIFFPLCGMLRRSGCVQIFLQTLSSVSIKLKHSDYYYYYV